MSFGPLDSLQLASQLGQGLQLGGESPAPLEQAARTIATVAKEAAPQAPSGAAEAATGLAAALAGEKSPKPAAEAAEAAVQSPQLATAAAHAAPPAADAAPAAARLLLEEHPLAGQAVMDFATPAPAFVPRMIDPADAPPAERLAAIASAAGITFAEGSRLLHLYAPLEGEKALLVESLSGRAALSEPYAFQLKLISKSGAIDLKELMAKNISVGVRQADGGEQFINGYVNTFGFTHSDGGFAYYQCEIVPWFAYLKNRVNSRIFQDETVLGVIEKIFKGDYGGLAAFEFRTNQAYATENYIVQYDETDENFISRLLEKHGLFYYFEHGPSGHVMIISDDSRSSEFCPPHPTHAEIEFNGGNRWRKTDAVTSLSAQRTVQPTQMALNTFDFKAPSAAQYVEMATVAQQGDIPTLEIYDGNPAFTYKDKEEGQRQARLRMEALEWQAKTFAGASDCRGLAAGHTFKLLGHHWFDATDETDNDFLVIAVEYEARNNYFGSDASDVYRNRFSAIRRKIPFRPRRSHRPPQMPGPQTATVVGPKGSEIHTDQYGRIKVHFHWDRYGRHDESSSCWIRVSQPWAGKGWGTVSIPRIGQEVIIDYLEGDPSRPVCTGRLFNAEQPAPYSLPDSAHMMGFKSRSTPGGGGYSEMVIHDSKGSELINIHAQKDMVTTVQNAHATTVNGPHQTNTVSQGYQRNTVKQQIEMVSETAYIDLRAKQHVALTAETEHIALTAKKQVEVQAQTEHVAVTAKKHVALTAETEHIAATAKKHIELKAETEHVAATAKKHIMLQAETEHIGLGANKFVDIKSDTQHIHLTANTDITLQVGASKIELRADGTITIQGVHVDIIGSDRIDLNK
jgi:type VI secretion system secreted protein VgrG